MKKGMKICFSCIASGVFAFVAAVHLLRAVNGWELVANGWPIPLWVSWVAVFVIGGLAIWGFNDHKQS